MQLPVGPSVAVMPGPYKPFDAFVQDDAQCRGWAANAIGLPGHEAAAQSVAASTALGAAIGALAGAAGDGGRAVGAGAAIGAATGAMVGTQTGTVAAWSVQQRYDIAYQQCMYAKGNQVPAYGHRTPAMPVPPAPPR